MTNYALDNLTPTNVVAPSSVAELAEALREACEQQQAVVPWGGGTRQHTGCPPTRYDLALVTTGLDRIVTYAPADLVVTVEAGITLGALQAELARHGQWLPWDPPLRARATLGGLLASGASGPLRLGYGAPRDWLLGMQVAGGDGRLVKSGGRVVKNVAGYDLHKLHLGAFGTLGVIAEATLKVAPLPEHRQTVLASFLDPRLPGQALAQLRAVPLQPIALIAMSPLAEQGVSALHSFLEGQPNHIVVAARFAGTAGAVARQIREAARRCIEVGARTVELREEDDQPLWAGIADVSAPASDGSLLLRVGVPSNALDGAASLMERVPHAHGWASARIVLAGVGLGYARWQIGAAPLAAVAAALAEVRAKLLALGGYAVVEEAPATFAMLDRWGPPPSGAALMRQLRARWDPAGILNPGRFVV